MVQLSFLLTGTKYPTVRQCAYGMSSSLLHCCSPPSTQSTQRLRTPLWGAKLCCWIVVLSAQSVPASHTRSMWEISRCMLVEQRLCAVLLDRVQQPKVGCWRAGCRSHDIHTVSKNCDCVCGVVPIRRCLGVVSHVRMCTSRSSRQNSQHQYTEDQPALSRYLYSPYIHN